MRKKPEKKVGVGVYAPTPTFFSVYFFESLHQADFHRFRDR